MAGQQLCLFFWNSLYFLIPGSSQRCFLFIALSYLFRKKLMFCFAVMFCTPGPPWLHPYHVRRTSRIDREYRRGLERPSHFHIHSKRGLLTSNLFYFPEQTSSRDVVKATESDWKKNRKRSERVWGVLEYLELKYSEARRGFIVIFIFIFIFLSFLIRKDVRGCNLLTET